MKSARLTLIGALLALAGLYVLWFARAADALPALLVFALPPSLLALAVWRGRPTAPFWAGVLALLWFCHGVVVAWTRAGERGFAWIEIALALVVVFAASLPGLRARRARRRPAAQ